MIIKLSSITAGAVNYLVSQWKLINLEMEILILFRLAKHEIKTFEKKKTMKQNIRKK